MKKEQIFSICTIALAALGLIFWLFLAGCSYKTSVMGVKAESSAMGMAMIFGGDIKVSIAGASETTKAFDFSFLLFIGFIAAIAGLVITILPLCGIKVKLFPVIALACFVVAALFCFLTKTACNPVDGGRDALKEYSLGIGAILGGICFIGAGVTSALPLVLKK